MADIPPTVRHMQEDIAKLERQVAQLKQSANLLCMLNGNEPIYSDADSAASAPIGSIKSDTFYGQPMLTAMRSYLDMRKATNRGPASVRDIYDALAAGGFQFGTASAENAQRTMRTTLSKASHTFHRLPNGDWGLLSWYPKPKGQKPAGELAQNGNGDTIEAESEETEAPPSKPEKASRPKGGDNAGGEGE